MRTCDKCPYKYKTSGMVGEITMCDLYNKQLYYYGDGIPKPDCEHNCFEEFMEDKMTLKEHDCQTVSCCTQLEFEETVSKLLNEGYEISSSSCNSSRDWKAILVK